MSNDPAPARADAAATAGHVPGGVAGFFASAADAQGAMEQLAATQSLQPTQLLLLSPDEASWISFTLRGRHRAGRAGPNGQAGHGDVWLVALTGALLAGLASATQLSQEGRLAADLTPVALALATLVGAAGGACLARLSGCLPPREVFSTIVRQQLAGGRWALVVHGVAWERQAASAALLRERGVDWCAVAAGQPTF